MIGSGSGGGLPGGIGAGIDLNATAALDSSNLQAVKNAARSNSPEALKAAAQQFEALFMNMMMKSMRDATPKDGMFDNEQSRMYTSMLDQKLSENFAKRGVGLADALMRQLGNNAAAQSSGQTDFALPGLDATAPAMPRGALPANAKPVSSAGLPAKQSAANAATASTVNSSSNNLIDPRSKRSASMPGYIRAFREKLAGHAEEASRLTGIPAKFMLGQAALESGWGKREISAKDGSTTHNVFGIKASAGWKGRVVEVPTTEYVNGVAQKRIEKFRAYDSYADAFKDYSRMLAGNARYKNVIASAQSVHGFAQGLQKAGYATDPNYADKLTRLIQQRLTV